MIKVENIDVYGFEAAIRGMRNPMNSWEKSDSHFCNLYVGRNVDEGYCPIDNLGEDIEKHYNNGGFVIGSNDLNLMKILCKTGTEHRKYLRMINVTMDIVAPLYWWKEYDTYKIGTVENSCSTMHKIHSKEFTLDDFSHEHLAHQTTEVLRSIVDDLNDSRSIYLKTKNKGDWWQMIQLLPSSYNQRRTVMLNYETVFNIIRQRKNHKLDEWVQFVEQLKELPYVKELME